MHKSITFRFTICGSHIHRIFGFLYLCHGLGTDFGHSIVATSKIAVDMQVADMLAAGRRAASMWASFVEQGRQELGEEGVLPQVMDQEGLDQLVLGQLVGQEERGLCQ